MESIRVTRIITTSQKLDNIYDIVFFVYVGRYIKAELNKEPDYTGVHLGKCKSVLLNVDLQNYIIYAEDKGWINDTFEVKKDVDELVRANKNEYVPVRLPIYAPDVRLIGYQKVYSREDIVDVFPQVKNSQLQFVYVSLMAYLLVIQYRLRGDQTIDEETTSHFLFKIPSEAISQKYSMVYFTHILRYPEIVNMIYIDNRQYIKRYQDYLTKCYLYDKLSSSKLNIKGQTVANKKKVLINDQRYAKGMPVIMYEKERNFTTSSKINLHNIQLYIVDSVEDDNLTLRYIEVSNTREGIAVTRKNNPQAQLLYTISDQQQDKSKLETLDLIPISELGIGGYMTYTNKKLQREIKKKNLVDNFKEEEQFIKSLDTTGIVKMYINRPELPSIDQEDHIDLQVEMSPIDAVYWFLKDWGISFAEELYKGVYADYFEYTTPLADLDTKQLIIALQHSDRVHNQEVGKVMQNLYIKGMKEGK